MIRINLAKALGGRKGGGGSPWGVARVLFLLIILAIGGAGFYVLYMQPKWFEDIVAAETLNKWIPDFEPVLAFVADLKGGGGEPDKPAVAPKATGKPEKVAAEVSKPAVAPEKPVEEAAKAADKPEKPVEEVAKVADKPDKPVAEAAKAADTPEKTVAAPKPKAADALEITYPSGAKAAEPEKKVAAEAPKTVPPAPEKIAEKPAAPEPKPADAPKKPAAPAPKPSSLVRSNMAEDVVKEFDNEARAVAAASRLGVTYAEMTVAEKINYEVMFGRNAFEMVTRCAPPGTKLKTLEIENFQTIYASGAGASREMVQEMFAAFRKERGELLPKPLSYIRDSDKGGYQFVITNKPLFGTEPNDPFQAIDYIGFKGGLQASLSKFSRMAGANGVKLTGAPVQASVEQAGQYRRFVYKASGVSTYQNFKKFVLALYGDKVTCAFKKVTMTPIKDEQVRVNMEILFTVKN